MYTFRHEVPEGQEGAIVSVVMGSQSDWPTMRKACEVLDQFGVPWERRIISAHRTPDRLHAYAKCAVERRIEIIIAGAGGAAHLPGMIASATRLPVHGVPIMTSALNGVDSLYSIVQMPRGVPVATFAIGEAGAINAALHAVRVLALENAIFDDLLKRYISDQTHGVPQVPVDPTTIKE